MKKILALFLVSSILVVSMGCEAPPTTTDASVGKAPKLNGDAPKTDAKSGNSTNAPSAPGSE